VTVKLTHIDYNFVEITPRSTIYTAVTLYNAWLAKCGLH